MQELKATGSGGSGDDDDDDDDSTPDNPRSETTADPGTPETTGTTETVTPDTPQGTTPQWPSELPDPNDPDRPERITIWEDGVPKTYVKTWDPVTQQWTYILDTDTPLDRMMLPKTGGRTRSGMMALLCLASLGGICISLRRRKTDDN